MAKKDPWELIAATVSFVVLTVIIPSFVIYGPWGAASENTNILSWLFYSIFCLSGFLVLFVKNVLDFQGFFERYPQYEGFDRFLSLHSPERSWIGSRVKTFRSLKGLISLSMLAAMVVAFSISVSGTFVSAPTLVEGSISNSANLILSVEPAVFAETMLIQFCLLRGLTALIYTFLKGQDASEFSSAFVANFLSVLAATLFALLYHSFRYSATEGALGGVAVLFLVLNVVTVVTHSIIPAYLIHAATNFFSKAISEKFISSESAVLIVIGVGLVAAAVFYRDLLQRVQ